MHKIHLTFPCQSCRCGRSQVLMGHPGWGHTAESRWTEGLELIIDKLKVNRRQSHTHNLFSVFITAKRRLSNNNFYCITRADIYGNSPWAQHNDPCHLKGKPLCLPAVYKCSWICLLSVTTGAVVYIRAWRPHRDTLPLEMVRAGDHCDRRMSRQMLPLLLIFGW